MHRQTGFNLMNKLALTLSIAVLAGSAFAGDFADLKYKGLGAGSATGIKFDDKSMNVMASQQKFKFTNVTNTHPISSFEGKTQPVFCVDLSQYTDTQGTQNYEIVTLDGLEALKNANQKDEKIAGLYKLMRVCGKQALNTSNNDTAAAFQTIAWDVLYDFDGTAASLNLDSGRFKSNLSGGAKAVYNNLKSGVLAEKDGSRLAGVYALRSNCNQDFIACVPEPGTYAAMGMGVAFILIQRKKKNRKN